MEFENDLGKPWRYQDGEFTVTRTSVWSPPGCHPVGCGLKLYVDSEGRLDHVEGDENDPITKGRLCPRCVALKDYVYNKSRVLYPMKRDPQYRGQDDKWERISWDEAIDMVVSKWKELTAKYGPETFTVMLGTGRDGMLQQDFIGAIFKTPNMCSPLSGFACYQPRMMASQMVLGALYPELDYAGGLPGGYDDPQYTVPEVMVVWAKAPLESNADGFFGHCVIDLMKRGAKLISVDPRVTWLSTRSEIQLRVRPGTDAAMGMAWANIIISEDLYDHDFVDKWCYGFDEFAARVKEMTPEKAAQICGVEADDIYAAARMYANAKPASIAWGLAFDQNPNGMQAAQAVVSLIAITGNLDVPGGNVIADLSAPEDMASSVKEDMAENNTDTRAFISQGWYSMPEELRNKCIGMDKYPLYCNQLMVAQSDCMLDTLETDEPYPVRMCWIQSTNFLAPSCSAEPQRWHKAMLRSFEFCFGTDVFMTPTIQATCDLFLPLSTVAEHDSVNRTHYGAASITTGIGNKAITVGEAKSDTEIECLLAHAMGAEVAEQYATPLDYLEKNRLEGRHKFDDVKKLVKFKRKVYYRKYELGKLRPDGQPGFLTATGRVELWSSGYAENGEDPLPYYCESPMSPVTDDYTAGLTCNAGEHSHVPESDRQEWASRDLPHAELAEKYPFTMTSGARTFCFFHSENRQVPVLREINPDPIVEINPEDAKEKGVVNGQWVELENMYGAAKYKAKVSPIVKQGQVLAQHGWWFPEQDPDEPSLYGVWQSNTNTLVPVHHSNELGFGAVYKCNCCNIVPLSESYDTDLTEIQERFAPTMDYITEVTTAPAETSGLEG